jgi:hypothetical protein
VSHVAIVVACGLLVSGVGKVGLAVSMVSSWVADAAMVSSWALLLLMVLAQQCCKCLGLRGCPRLCLLFQRWVGCFFLLVGHPLRCHFFLLLMLTSSLDETSNRKKHFPTGRNFTGCASSS